MASATIGPKNY